MSYKFEINSTCSQDMKIIVEYLAYHKHLEEISPNESKIKFKGDVITSLSHIKYGQYNADLEKINYLLGYSTKDFEFTIGDKYQYQVSIYVNEDTPLNFVRLNPDIILFCKIVFSYKDPAAKEFLIKESWKWYHDYHDHSDSDKMVLIYLNTDKDYFRKIAERPKRDLNTIYLPNSEKQQIVEKIENFLKPETRNLYSRLGKTYKLIIALHGLPGTGKTSFIHSLASKFNYSVSIYFNNRKNEDTDIPTLLQGIRRNSFLVFEDADSLFNTREETKNNSMTFSTILNVLDGFASPVNPKNPLIIFVTTNCLDKLDKTMIRPGRIDHFMEFKEMRNKEIKAMMKKFCEETYTNELGEDFCNGLKSSKYKVTPALLEIYFFKYLNQPDKIISELDEIGTLKDIVETKKNDLYT